MKVHFVIVSQVSDAGGQREYWTGDIQTRNYCQCPIMTANISMAKTYSNEKVARKSAEVLYRKTEGKRKFSVMRIEERG